MERLEAKNVRYEYRTKLQVVRAVNGVSCVFEPGRVYAVVGASGCGKTCWRVWTFPPAARSSLTAAPPQTLTATHTGWSTFRSSIRISICFITLRCLKMQHIRSM